MIIDFAFGINTITLAICIVIACSIFLSLRSYQLVYGYINVFIMWALVSTYANDLGDYNFEIKRYTYTTLATSYLALLYALFNLGFYLAYRYSKRFELALGHHRYFRLPTSLSLNYFIAFFVLAVLGVHLLSVGSQAQTVLQGYLSRADTVENGNMLAKVLTAYPFLAPVLISTIANIPGRGFKKIGVLGLLLYLTSLVFMGHKFSGLFEALFYYLATYYFSSSHRSPHFNASRLMKLAVNWRTLSIISVLSYLIYLSYTKVALGSFNILLELLYERIFLFQGQLFWTSFVDYVSNGGPDTSQLLVEVKKIIGDEDVSNAEVGMQYVMIKALGSPAHIIIDKGFLYTMAFPGILLYMLDYVYICLIMLILGATFMMLTLLWKLGVMHRSLTLQLLTLSIFGPLISLLFTGNLVVFFTLLLGLKIFLLMSILIAGVRR
jgi:hypothetical protein